MSGHAPGDSLISVIECVLSCETWLEWFRDGHLNGIRDIKLLLK